MININLCGAEKGSGEAGRAIQYAQTQEKKIGWLLLSFESPSLHLYVCRVNYKFGSTGHGPAWFCSLVLLFWSSK